MAEKVEIKADALPDLDDLLQCPVCYEIPSAQIFQCNEGHHVCGRCKVRLDVCPVCRALFFGTRNYAMEELIANVRKLQAFKLGGKITTVSSCSESNTQTKDTITVQPENNTAENEENDFQSSHLPTVRPPLACKGLFRCLCCKNGNGERLPAARLLNHLRYYHAPDLIEGQSENGEYLQAWQISTVPGRIVIAIRIADMGIFFLVIEMNNDCLCAWLTMAAAPWVAHEFSYTITISGNDREAIFTDCVWSVRSCEGSLKKRGHCLALNGLDARAITAPVSINGKLSVRRTPTDQLAHQNQPRTVLRVANRGNSRDNVRAAVGENVGPFLQHLQNDVARLSLAFATFGREADALVRSEAEVRSRRENGPRTSQSTNSNDRPAPEPEPHVPSPNVPIENIEPNHLSRSARSRLRHRLRAALNAPQPPLESAVTVPAQNAQHAQHTQHVQHVQHPQSAQRARRTSGQSIAVSQIQSIQTPTNSHHMVGEGTLQQPSVPSPNFQSVPSSSMSGSSNGNLQNGNNVRANKKKRRHRR